MPSKESGNNETIDIPCVLGAGYAFSVDLWKKIHGLNGLIKYGLDEQFISLKVWLSGGKCQLIPNIELGHVYRDFAPYEMSALEFIYNKMLITSLIFPNLVNTRYLQGLELKIPRFMKKLIS